MNPKHLFFGYATFVGIMFSLVLFTDESVVNIEEFDAATLSANEIGTYRQTVSANEWKTHCQLGQIFLDGKYTDIIYQDSFYHFFLCGKSYSWPGGVSREGVKIPLGVHVTYKQFIPAFKSDGIRLALQTAKENALAYVQASDLSERQRDRAQQRVNGGYNKAVVAQKRVSSGRTYRDIIVFHLLLGLLLLIVSPPNISRVFKRVFARRS